MSAVSMTFTSVPLIDKDADRLVDAVGDEREVTCRIEAEARWLLADRHGIGEFRWVGF
jgi:hypothetical protein